MDADVRHLLREKAEAATPGPWRHGFADGSGTVEEDRAGGGYVVTADDECVVSGADDSWSIPQGVRTTPDAEFIAACSPDGVLALLNRIEELEAENARLRGES